MDAPPGFVKPGEEDPCDTDALAVEFGHIDGYRVVYERASQNWATYSPDLPGCVSTGRTRQAAERNMREAIALHLEGRTGNRGTRATAG